jgi:hypothetical protein
MDVNFGITDRAVSEFWERENRKILKMTGDPL